MDILPSRMDNHQLILTYTCPVSRVTYAGHPRDGYLYRFDNDHKEAVHTIKSLALKYGQPVSWVINDQEYLDLEGLLPELLEYQKSGDSILVTMELTTSPEGVDKFDTAAVIHWIDGKCREKGLTPDGLWSLKFLESDLKALSTLDIPWTRNLAGSCWHQQGIDDSTWRGCPFGPYYPSLTNTKSPAQAGQPHEFLMLEWLTRDAQAVLSGGSPAVFSLDPADSNRIDTGGYPCEKDALEYSIRLVEEAARQSAFNETVVVNINEEARHYQTEGHDKTYMLNGMFARFSELAVLDGDGVGVRQMSYGEVWKAFRERYAANPEGLFVFGDIDGRKPPVEGGGAYNNRVIGDRSALYQTEQSQSCFLRSRGPLPMERYDYTKAVCGNDGNDPYPESPLPELQLREYYYDQVGPETTLHLNVFAAEPVNEAAIMLWDAPVKGSEQVTEISGKVRLSRAVPGGLLVVLDLEMGANEGVVTLTN